MSTQLRDMGFFVEVSTVVGKGKQRKVPRSPVLVPWDDLAGVEQEIIRQAELARADLGVDQSKRRPVV